MESRGEFKFVELMSTDFMHDKFIRGALNIVSFELVLIQEEIASILSGMVILNVVILNVCGEFLCNNVYIIKKQIRYVWSDMVNLCVVTLDMISLHVRNKYGKFRVRCWDDFDRMLLNPLLPPFTYKIDYYSIVLNDS